MAYVDYGKEIENLMKKYREEIYVEIFHRVASNVYKKLRELYNRKGVKGHFTADEFAALYDEKTHVATVKMVAFEELSLLECKRSHWSGGHSVSNLLEQEQQTVIFKFFDQWKIVDNFPDMKEYIVASLREQEQKGE